jgi:hypothetical protein
VTWLVLAFIFRSVVAPQSPEEFARADAETRRLPPSAIPGLPAPVREALEQRGCTIPQVTGKDAPHNAVRGALTAPTAIEWAVLCSRSKVSSILVIRESSGVVVSELARREDVSFLQRAGPLGIIFSREISVATRDAVRTLRSRANGRSSSPTNHDAIRDEFVDKYAIVWSWDGRKWLRLAGSN